MQYTSDPGTGCRASVSRLCGAGRGSRPNAQRDTAVVLSATEYGRLLEENEILRDVCQAQEQMEAGLGIPHAEAKAQVMAALKP